MRLSLLLAKALLLLPVRLFLGSFKREKLGDAPQSGVWAASMGGGRGTVYMGRLGILPSILIMAQVTMMVIVMFIVAGAGFIVLSPVILVSKLLSRPSKPVLDSAIPASGRVLPDDADTPSLRPRQGTRDAGR